MQIRKRIYKILEDNNHKIGKIFNIFIMGLIVFNILSIILESETIIYNRYYNIFKTFEVVSVIIFSIEYICRLLTADIMYPQLSRPKAILKLIKKPILIIDLLAILPFYLPLFLIDLRFLRAFRLFRVARIFKMNRYSKALNIVGKVIYKKKEELLSSMYIMGFILLISSILMYYVESPVQPKAFSSIFATLWWGIATLTTIGYGDIYPITAMGKILASIIAITSIGIVALPTGIISSGFFDEINNEDYETHICPKCGERFED